MNIWIDCQTGAISTTPLTDIQIEEFAVGRTKEQIEKQIRQKNMERKQLLALFLDKVESDPSILDRIK